VLVARRDESLEWSFLGRLDNLLNLLGQVQLVFA